MANRFNFRAWSGLRMTTSGIQFNSSTSELEFKPPGILMQSTGMCDAYGTVLFDGDVVPLAGYGDYVCEFPYTDLYESAAEGDVGRLKGNIHENPELLEKAE